jgi:hypothetical protein
LRAGCIASPIDRRLLYWLSEIRDRKFSELGSPTRGD